jgi:uncharacterized protein (DUF488 family)
MPRAELRMPTESRAVQESNKQAWNESRSVDDADFYTVGYSGREIDGFVALLVAAGVRSLLDIRFTPVSMYKPDFSKRNLERALAEHGIEYIHEPALGVPRDIRGRAVGKANRDTIWLWYDDEVVPRFASRNLHWFFNSIEHPVALMCTEIDPTSCHRHRLALAFGKQGLKFFDL